MPGATFALMSIIFWAIVLYILYKLIFGFIIPVISATYTVKSKIKSMRQDGGNFQERNQSSSATKADFRKEEKASPAKEDYIDFEEIK